MSIKLHYLARRRELVSLVLRLPSALKTEMHFLFGVIFYFRFQLAKSHERNSRFIFWNVTAGFVMANSKNSTIKIECECCVFFKWLRINCICCWRLIESGSENRNENKIVKIRTLISLLHSSCSLAHEHTRTHARTHRGSAAAFVREGVKQSEFSGDYIVHVIIISLCCCE